MKKNNLPILLLSLLLVVLIEGFYFGFSTDDPFISFRYAENFANGHGLAFNPGERVEGYSNFLFVIIMALFSACRVSGLGMLIAGKAVGIACTLGIFLLLYYGIRSFERNGPVVNAGTLLLLSTNSLLATWMVGGMETGLFALLLTAAIVLRGRELRCPGIPFSSFLLALLALTRPEGVLYFLSFFLASVFWNFFRRVDKKRLLFYAALDFVFFISIAGVFELWRISYYHELLPNTFYVKVAGSALSRMAGGVYYLVRAALSVSLVLPALLLTRVRNNPMRFIALIGLATGVLFILYAGGDWMPGLRFFIPVVPVLYYLAIAGVVDYLPLGGSPGINRSIAVFPIIIMLNLILTGYCLKTETAITHEPAITDFYRHHDFPLWNTYSSIGNRIKNTTSENAVIALGEAGIIPYVCKRRIVDLFGLNDHRIARRRGPDQFSKETDCDYILGRADYILLGQSHLENGQLVCQFRYGNDLLANQQFRSSYCLEWQESGFSFFRKCR